MPRGLEAGTGRGAGAACYDSRLDMVTARDALERLREGNERFVSNVRGPDVFVSHTRRVQLTAGQEPIGLRLRYT